MMIKSKTKKRIHGLLSKSAVAAFFLAGIGSSAFGAEKRGPEPNRLLSEDPPAAVRDFSGGATGADVMTVDFLVYGSDGLAVPGLVCGGNLAIHYRLPGEDKVRSCNIAEDGTYKGRTFQYVLNPVNLLDTTEAARGFQPGDDYDPDPETYAGATRLANRLLLNPKALIERFITTFEAVEGIRPVPLDVSTGMEVYPRAPMAYKQGILSHPTDLRYYSRGASPHQKILLVEDGQIIRPMGDHVRLGAVLWRRTEHTDFTAGEAIAMGDTVSTVADGTKYTDFTYDEVLELTGNRLPESSFAAWGWQNGYGGLQYGDYMPGLGMHFVPAMALGESWDFLYNGNIHIRPHWQQTQPCYVKPMIWGTYTHTGKAYASEFAPVAFGRVPPRKTVDPARPTQQVRVFDDPDTWYAPQDDFSYGEDRLEVMKWERRGQGSAQIVRGGHFLQGGAALLFPGADAPSSMRKPIASDGMEHITLTTHWFHAPAEGYHPNGAFQTVEFADAASLTIAATADDRLTVSRPDAAAVTTDLTLKPGWNEVALIHNHDSTNVYLRLNRVFAAANGRRLTFPAAGGMTAIEIGRNVAPAEDGNVLFDSIWINPNDNLADNFEYASQAEMTADKTWKTAGNPVGLDAEVAYSGRQSVMFAPDSKPASLTRALLPDLRDHTLQLAWYQEPSGGDDSYVELRSSDGKQFLGLRSDRWGWLQYRTESADWTTTDTRFRPEFLDNWNELVVIFDPEGNVYLRMNMEWVNQADGRPLLIPARDKLDTLVLGRGKAEGGTVVRFDDLRVVKNFRLVGNATFHSSTFEYPLEAAACFRELGWTGIAEAGARLQTGYSAANGRRCLLLPGNAPAGTPVVREFPDDLQDVTAQFSWYHGANELKQKDCAYAPRVDAGYVRLVDGSGNRLTLSSGADGRARYRVNDGDWQATDHQLVDGWNKTRVVIGAGKPVEFWMAPQRAGIHPKEQWKLQKIATYGTDKVESDFCQELETVLTGLRSVEVGRQAGSEADFLFDDLLVTTNKETARQTKQYDFGNTRVTLADELDNRLANRDWPEIEKTLKEKRLLEGE